MLPSDPHPCPRHEDPPNLRALELFCGIGGAATALAGRARVALAMDTHPRAVAVYRHNFPTHAVSTTRIESVPVADLAAVGADLWWMSPPCQPYTHRGLRRDGDDPRARALHHLVDAVDEVRPRYVALENVPGFQHSDGHRALRAALDRAEYEVDERVLCPTSLGLPCRRRRFYLVAARGGLATRPPPTPTPRAVRDLLDLEPDPTLYLDPETARRYPFALDRVDPGHREAKLACFTAAYGRSLVKSGSYMIDGPRLRRLSPAEVLRALGFPEWFHLPADLAARHAWPLVGNSLAVPAVAYALSAIPELSAAAAIDRRSPPRRAPDDRGL